MREVRRTWRSMELLRNAETAVLNRGAKGRRERSLRVGIEWIGRSGLGPTDKRKGSRS